MCVLAAACSLLASGAWAQQTLADGTHPRRIEAVELATAWVEMYDHGRHDSAYALLAPSVRERISFEKWQRQAREENRKLGAPAERHLVDIVFDHHAAGATQPGLHARAEFLGRYAHADVVTRWLHLYSPDGGPFEILDQGASYALKPANPSPAAR